MFNKLLSIFKLKLAMKPQLELKRDLLSIKKTEMKNSYACSQQIQSGI